MPLLFGEKVGAMALWQKNCGSRAQLGPNRDAYGFLKGFTGNPAT
jgi:hypothetical protein